MRVLRPVSVIPTELPDLARFVTNVAERASSRTWAEDSAANDTSVFAARAPGRLDVMGGIADYSGSLVLQWPIREATRVALRPWGAQRISITSVAPDARDRHCDVPLDVVGDPDRPYDEVRAWFAADPNRHWAGYVAGVFHVLAREHSVRFPGGAAILVESDVPEGKGVSSSAAIEAATMEAVIAAWQVAIEPRLRAIRCQQVENLIVGAPCGVMDQMASICGETGALMSLLCQPAEFRGSVPLPDHLRLWGIDSGIRHAVTGADYGAVRVGAFMGYRILAELAGLPVRAGDREGHVRVDDRRWQGYLANVGTDAFRRFAPDIPETLDGAEFLARYQGTTDLVTRVDRSRRYAVRTPTAHPIHEHERVTEWARELTSSANAIRLGELMYESHASYSACGLGSDGTDRLVALAREAGIEHGIYGAKITGGGSGGTVAVLADAGAGDAVRMIARRYATERPEGAPTGAARGEGVPASDGDGGAGGAKPPGRYEATGRDAYVFEGSSPGAARVGAIRLDPA